ASMLATLTGRLYYVQLLDPHKPTQTAHLLHDGTIVVPAPRGQIVDAAGRPLVNNTSVQLVTVDYQTLQSSPDHGHAVLARLGALLGTPAAALAKQITPCSPTVPAPCWTGQPYQPVPVAVNAPTSAVLAIAEHREDFAGVALQTETMSNYPNASLAAHVLGYTAQITAADKNADSALNDADQIGQTGLEAQYDAYLRGVDGTQDVLLDPQGVGVANGTSTPPVQGDTLVTSIDLNVQKLAEQSLAQQIAASRKAGKSATSGAVVVMDPNSGRVIAIASYPSFNPQEFVGGISDADYAALTGPHSNDPLVGRAVAGQYAPGSTFKLITSTSLVAHNEINMTDTYPCPGSLTIDGRVKTNYDSEILGDINLQNALGYSCDTFFYAPAAAEYYADQALVDAGKKAHEYLQQTAAAYGVGEVPGIDLPTSEQASGSYADRETRLARWNADKSLYCAQAKPGYYNSVADLAQREYLSLLASQNCTDGWRYRAGDNADMAIGQGETTMSPLQLAIAYSAMLNGGKIFEPTLGWAIVNGQGKVVKTITPTVKRTLNVSKAFYKFFADSLDFSRGWAVSGAFAYIGSSYQNELGGKTGTAEVEGKQDTSWLASWGPTHTDTAGNVTANFVIVGMIEQAGTGATAAGPMLKRIYDGLMGADGKPPLLPGIKAETKLPAIAPQVRTSTR
ncbi:MAG: penicillin-binding transpeptidase domain-containing protein, partial [Jatrophihabitantaceae bacterium]